MHLGSQEKMLTAAKMSRGSFAKSRLDRAPEADGKSESMIRGLKQASDGLLVKQPG